jgi:hypothetical protein
MSFALHEKFFVGHWVVEIPTCGKGVDRIIELHGFGVAVIGNEISESHVSGDGGVIVAQNIEKSFEWFVDVQDSWLGPHCEGQECSDLLERQ